MQFDRKFFKNPSIYLLCGFYALTITSFGYCFFHYKKPSLIPSGDNGQPLILTPLLKNGEYRKARHLARVHPIVGQVDSYSGFFTVNETYNSNHFFWFFPAIKSPDKAPIVVWLQGGPGASSMFGLFSEHGPYMIEKNKTISLRKYSWTKTLSVLYIDNPVGAGYSFTDHDNGYTKCEEEVAINLYESIIQFFQLFPQLLKNEFYVTGESYGGKYAPALAYIIHEKNKNSNNIRINLKGVAIGNGFSDPINMLDYGKYLFEIGLIDKGAKAVFDEAKDKAKKLIKDGNMKEAFKIFDNLLDGDLTNSTSIFTKYTGFQNYFNYLYASEPDLDSSAEIVQQDSVRQKIHVGNLLFNVNKTCESHLQEDIMRSVAPWIEVLLDNKYKFMVYNGQLDIIVAYPLSVEFLNNLNWTGAEAYKNTPRHIWKVSPEDREVAGYVRIVDNLIEVLVRNAGHMVPADQPRAAYDLINRFIYRKSFF